VTLYRENNFTVSVGKIGNVKDIYRWTGLLWSVLEKSELVRGMARHGTSLAGTE
jgi:hypothetical protein